jgi:hypothetical protein
VGASPSSSLRGIVSQMHSPWVLPLETEAPVVRNGAKCRLVRWQVVYFD